MDYNSEKAEVIRKLARKNNWGHKYDRLEHFKRFQNLDKIIKELSNKKWLLIYKKSNFTGIALNSEFKKEIIDFVKKIRPDLSDLIY